MVNRVWNRDCSSYVCLAGSDASVARDLDSGGRPASQLDLSIGRISSVVSAFLEARAGAVEESAQVEQDG